MSAYSSGNLSCEHWVYMHLGRKMGTVLKDDLIRKVPPPPQRTTAVPGSVSTSPLWEGGGTLNRSTRHLPNELFASPQRDRALGVLGPQGALGSLPLILPFY